MKQTITSELFFFNTKTDYLPYYKTYTFDIDEDKSINDLLSLAKEKIGSYEYAKNNAVIAINSCLVDTSLNIKELVSNFGNEIKIEPLSTYRATHDLIVNDDDFYQKLKVLEEFCDESDKEYYNTLYRAYYSSSTLRFNDDYFGDSIFLLASRLINKNENNINAILEIIDDELNGISLYEFENNTYPSIDVQSSVDELKKLLYKKTEEENSGILGQISKKLNSFAPKKEETANELKTFDEVNFASIKAVHSFSEFSIATYNGTKSTKELCEKSKELIAFVGANEINFNLSDKACGADIFDNASSIAHKKASEILTDAFDSSADILVVNSELERKLFSSKELQELAGREINLQVLTSSQLLEISLGNKNKKELGLQDSNVTFI